MNTSAPPTPHHTIYPHMRAVRYPIAAGGAGGFLALCLLIGIVSHAAATSSHPNAVQLPQAAARKGGLHIATAKGMRRIDIATLESLGLKAVNTSTFWPADDGIYQGPLLADVLKFAGLEQARAIRVSALDGFSQVIPRQDWQRWPVLLATRRDGRLLGIRDKGPLRIIYPRDLDRRLHDTIYRLRWVWLIDRIEPVEGYPQ